MLFQIKVWAVWFYLVLTTRRHSSFFSLLWHCCFRSSCIIEILVAALIIFHANLVCAQHLCGVWRSALMAAGFCSQMASCLCSVLFSTQASQWWEEHQNYKGPHVWLCPPARTPHATKTIQNRCCSIQVCPWRTEPVYQSFGWSKT